MPISVAGGADDDRLTGGPAPEVLAGGDGVDTLTGNGGTDEYFGEGGNDIINARDGAAERISCGAGVNDRADNDFIDIIAECETGVDADGDGFNSTVDCDDTKPQVRPGAPELFENGVDEDCDGRDNVNLAQLATVVTNRWLVAGGSTVLRALIVRNAPKGARIVLRCEGRGCPIDRPRREKVRRNLAKVVLHFKGGNGNDGLFGGGGFDSFDGGPDNDKIVARVAAPSPSNVPPAPTLRSPMTSTCASPASRARAMPTVMASAGRPTATTPSRRSVPDAPDDGIDQDCSGADATDLDRDKDGFSRPQDCNDADAAVKPGAKEKPGNAVDENCDREIRPFPPLAGSVANAWLVEGGGTRNVALAAKEFPRGTVIKMRCAGPGCSIGDVRKRVTRRGQAINLHSALGDRRLRRARA